MALIDWTHDVPLHSGPMIHPRPEQQTSEPSASSSPPSGPSGCSISTSFQSTSAAADDHDPISRHSVAQTSLADIEGIQPPLYTRETDPFQLSSKIKTPREINLVRPKTSRECAGYGSITINKAAVKAKKLQQFYKNQNENIQRWLRPVDEHVRLAKEFDGANQLKLKIAVQGSFAANVLLAALQVYGAVSSGSLSLFTTMADAIFDPMSNITLIACNRAVKTVDARKYPSGKARIETAGNIVFCFLMTAVSFLLIVLSTMELAHGSESATKSFHFPSVIAVAVAFCTKLCLFIYCWALRNDYSQIRILWEDHRNDLFINGFGLLTSIGGSKLKWWLDPMGAIILSCLISTLWLRTANSEFQLLIGVSANTQKLQWITYISMTHSPQILALDTVRAYHSGPRIIVEVDVVMAPDETLRDTHDVAEALQVKLESLPDVERAYVHIDYETVHKPEHGKKNV
ncbi:hypothetical protein MMC29_006105 [Sticta canariensis]|nr:hypothetical protein [Sticta canariensis]